MDRNPLGAKFRPASNVEVPDFVLVEVCRVPVDPIRACVHNLSGVRNDFQVERKFLRKLVGILACIFQRKVLLANFHGPILAKPEIIAVLVGFNQVAISAGVKWTAVWARNDFGEAGCVEGIFTNFSLV